MNALIIETAFPGDVVISLALAEELKRLDPEGTVSYLVRPDVVELLCHAPAVDAVFEFDKRGADSGRAGLPRLAARLNGHHFDTIFQLHSSQRSNALVDLLDAKSKIAFGYGESTLGKILISGDGHASRLSRAISLLGSLYPEVNLGALPRLSPPVPKVLNEWSHTNRRLVVFAPGSVWQTKRWGDDRFVLLSEILEKHPIDIVTIGLASEMEVGEEVVKKLGPNRALNLAGSTSLAEAAGVISKCDLLLGNDSAPSHLATATGVRSIVLFGPSLPSFGFSPPLSLGMTIEVEGLWCRPCSTHGSMVCPVYDHRCMTEITPERVAEAILGSFPA